MQIEPAVNLVNFEQGTKKREQHRLPTLPQVRCVSGIGAFPVRAMLNIDAFRDRCRRGAAEKDPAKLQDRKEALRLMLGMEQIGVIWRGTETLHKTELNLGSVILFKLSKLGSERPYFPEGVL